MSRKISRILSGFNRTIKKLEKLQNKNDAKIASHRAAIAGHNNMIDVRQQMIEGHNFESKQAAAIADKIKALIS